MSERVIRVKVSRDAIRRAIGSLPGIARAGGAPGNAIMMSVGRAALGRIKRAFIVKARGGTDDAGASWAPLKSATIARRQLVASRRAGTGEASASVEILRDTGLLLDSLSPDVSVPEQIFRVLPGECVVGTNRKGAATHHYGNKARHIPQRRLWPDPASWPATWWLDMTVAARDALLEVAIQMIRESR